MTRQKGIHNFYEYKFSLAVLLNIVAITMFYETDNKMGLEHVILPGCIAVLVVSTLAWRFKLLGSPRNQVCVVLHFILMISIVFMLNRVFSSSTVIYPKIPFPTTLNDVLSLPISLLQFASGVLFSLVSHLFAVAILGWFGTAILLVFVLFSIILPRKHAVTCLFLGFIFIALCGLKFGSFTSSFLFLLGMGALMACVILMHEDANRYDFWASTMENIKEQHRYPRVANEIEIDILGNLYKNKRIASDTIKSIVAYQVERCCDKPGTASTIKERSEISMIAKVLIEKLIYQDGLVVLEQDKNGQFLALNAHVYHTEPLFVEMAYSIHSALVIVIAAAYVLSPVDLIPDVIPAVGVLDDLAISALGGAAIWKNRSREQ